MHTYIDEKVSQKLVEIEIHEHSRCALLAVVTPATNGFDAELRWTNRSVTYQIQNFCVHAYPVRSLAGTTNVPSKPYAGHRRVPAAIISYITSAFASRI